MTRDETIALWMRCEAVRKAEFDAAVAAGRDSRSAYELSHQAAEATWNVWAEEMLAWRNAIEKDGGGLDALAVWRHAATADFSRFHFVGSAGLEPPASQIVISGDRVKFSGFLFPGPVSFRETTFGLTAWFKGAIFHGPALFEEASFAVDAWFEFARFNDLASFDEAGFALDAWFENVAFMGNTSFVQATFKGYTTFSEARFAQAVNFTAISGERAFQLGGARFEREPPSFVQADFKKAPRFDNVHVPAPHRFARGDRERAARYRTLRQLADAGLDHGRERIFFKSEVRSNRWVMDKPWHPAFWLGLAYDVFSDFGESIARPIILWLISLFAVANFYLAIADGKNACEAHNGAPVAQSLFLSLKSGLVLLANYRDYRTTRAYHCLFNGPADAPDIPFSVTVMELAHTLWSAILIFLLLLAVRNLFRIR